MPLRGTARFVFDDAPARSRLAGAAAVAGALSLSATSPDASATADVDGAEREGDDAVGSADEGEDRDAAEGEDRDAAEGEDQDEGGGDTASASLLAEGHAAAADLREVGVALLLALAPIAARHSRHLRRSRPSNMSALTAASDTFGATRGEALYLLVRRSML